jgi:hypothetical protein
VPRGSAGLWGVQEEGAVWGRKAGIVDRAYLRSFRLAVG